jgi:uncharacterized membrane protein
MNKHQMLLWGLVGVAAGLYFGGATTGTGLYSLPVVGTLFDSVYVAGNGLTGSGTSSGS